MSDRDEWDEKARELCRELNLFSGRRVPNEDGCDMVIEPSQHALAAISAALRSAAAKSTSERAMRVVESAITYQAEHDACCDCTFGTLTHKVKLHAPDCVLVAEGFIDRTGKRSGGG